MMMTFVLPVLIYLIAVNLIAVWAFKIDKQAAINRQRRIAEKTLLSLAYIGGAMGCVYAQQKFRHKTRKQPFKTFLYGALLFNLVIALACLDDGMRGQILEFLKSAFS